MGVGVEVGWGRGCSVSLVLERVARGGGGGGPGDLSDAPL